MKRFTFNLPSQLESLATVRKAPVRAGQSHRDKRNDYKRKAKFHKGWGAE